MNKKLFEAKSAEELKTYFISEGLKTGDRIKDTKTGKAGSVITRDDRSMDVQWDGEKTIDKIQSPDDKRYTKEAKVSEKVSGSITHLEAELKKVFQPYKDVTMRIDFQGKDPRIIIITPSKTWYEDVFTKTGDKGLYKLNALVKQFGADYKLSGEEIIVS